MSNYFAFFYYVTLTAITRYSTCDDIYINNMKTEQLHLILSQ